eukprot:7202575-Alexandrium_andersonii.AAC.1
MSASLVGSEMCIRDRATAPVWAGIVCCVPGSRRVAIVEGTCGPRRGRAVSYTHLTLPTICSV